MAVFISLSRKVPGHLLKGDIVDLGDLDSFSVYLSSQGSPVKDEFNISLINWLKVRFRPSSDISCEVKTAAYSKVNGGLAFISKTFN